MHQFAPAILRQYDIRGTYGINLSKDDAFLLGEKFAYFMYLNDLKTICIGRDGRNHSEELTTHLIEALMHGGIHVFDIGLGPTPMLSFALKHLKTDASIMVTGSHNPPQDNGFKITLKNRPFFGEDIQLLSHLIVPKKHAEYGLLEDINVLDSYINRLLQELKIFKDFRVVWDPGNGATCPVINNLVTMMPGDHIVLNSEVDGDFPAHPPDPTNPKNLEELCQTVIKSKASIGIAFDGDGDRVVVVDEIGNPIQGDLLLCLYASDILKKHPGAKIITEVKSSQTVKDVVESLGGELIYSKTGHSFIKAKMLDTKALLAGEVSGHMFFADTYYGFDDGLFGAIRILNILSHTPMTLSSMLQSLPSYYSTPELRIDCLDDKKFNIIEDIKHKLSLLGRPFIDLDGIKVIMEDGWWLVRASNTQPALVVRAEANNPTSLESIKKEMKNHLLECGIQL